jgi:predicted MFS family arabinose efflux permease
VYAYGATGPASVGFVAVAQLVPAAIAAPMTARLGDRVGPGRAISLAYGVIGLAMLATGAAMALAWPPVVVYVLAACVVVAYTSVRPIQITILPGLVGRAEQLTAANALSTILEGVGVLVGPLLCGIVVAVASPAAVYLGAAAATLLAGLLTLRLGIDAIARAALPAPRPSDVTEAVESPDEARPSTGSDAERGLAAVTASPSRWMSVVVLATRFGVAATMDVLLVLASIELFGMGAAGAGYLSAAIGLGWVLGGATTLVIVGRPRLTPLLLVGGLIWAVPIVVMALVAQPTMALTALVGAGIGLAVVDVAVRTVLQRLVSTDQLASVFGIAEGASMGCAAIGALVAGGFVAVLGLTGAMVAAGVILPIVAALVLPQVGRGEGSVRIPFREIALLRRIALFAPVPAPVLEAAASALVPVSFEPGTTVIRQGDIGDRFWIVEAGEVEVEQGGTVIARLGPGSSFGELALIRDIPRTASVVAVGDVDLLALDRDAFLIALTASPRAVAEASRVAADHLERDAAAVSSGPRT